jgi:hypothetical protein
LATAGSILSNVRLQFGDPNRDFISDTIGFEWLDIAQQRFCHDVLQLDEIKDYPITARQRRYNLPTNCIIPMAVTWWKNSSRKLKWVDPSEFEQYEVYKPLTTGYPTVYSEIRRQIVLGPGVPTSDSATALASGDFSSTATTLGFTVASGTFRTRGFLENQTTGEVVEYTNIATTTTTGCVRGVHGTSAASVASGQQWKEVDLQARYRKTPSLITASTQSPDIPAAFHRYLEQFALFLAWRSSGDKPKSDAAYAQFMQEEEAARKIVSRRAYEPRAVKDRRVNFGYPGGWWNDGM